jgi:phage repressor protein C with HTH and peptisase S24 domain
MATSESEICQRLRDVRVLHFGDRGRSKLCRLLGIQPSTYSLYEVNRVPPADLLVRVAQITGVRLEWLLSGQGAMSLAAEAETAPAARRPSRVKPTANSRHDGWIPIVGGTAAGKARFWEELPVTHGGPEADARLERVLQDYVTQTEHEMGAISPCNHSHAVSLIQLSTPDERGFLEFLNLPEVRRKHPAAVAWRIDGESMSPRYRDGDLVITSDKHPAVAGHPCVARQSGQIGVNCKIYQESGNEVLLIPINEACPIQRFPRKQLMWAWRVLFSVRLSSTSGS